MPQRGAVPAYRRVSTSGWYGVRFTLDIVPAPGFGRDVRPNLKVSCSWEWLGVSDSSINTKWVGWTLWIRPDLVERITLAAAEGKTGRELSRFIDNVIYWE